MKAIRYFNDTQCESDRLNVVTLNIVLDQRFGVRYKPFESDSRHVLEQIWPQPHYLKRIRKQKIS